LLTPLAVALLGAASAIAAVRYVSRPRVTTELSPTTLWCCPADELGMAARFERVLRRSDTSRSQHRGYQMTGIQPIERSLSPAAITAKWHRRARPLLEAKVRNGRFDSFGL